MAPDLRGHPESDAVGVLFSMAARGEGSGHRTAQAALGTLPTQRGRDDLVAATPDLVAATPDLVAATPDLATVLASAVPGPELAAVLSALNPDEVDDAVLVEVVAAAARVQGWAHALAAQAAGALSERDSMRPNWSEMAGGAPTQACVAGDELAMRLCWSRRAATRLVEHGRLFHHVLGATGDALAAGQIGLVGAQLVADRLAGLPVEVALAVQDRVLPEADRRTPTQLRNDLERALIAVDPDEAADRRVHARRGRRVDRPRVLPDGMAGLWAVLPAATAVRIDSTLDAAARTARSAGDERTLDQLRADGLGDLVLHTACAATASPLQLGGAPGRRYPAPAPHCGRADERAGDYDGGSSPRDGRGGDGGPSSPEDGSERSAESRAGILDVADVADVAENRSRPRCSVVSGRAQVRVTVALSTLLGVDEEPGDLAGYGPIDATTARALAEGGIWRRVVTDPLSGTVLDVGRSRYRPPDGMVEHVRARDRTCARPGCSATAESCDIDHTVPFHAAPDRSSARPSAVVTPASGTPRDVGRTATDNLGPLCRRDHRLKTDGGFILRQTAPGVYTWTTPAGHSYRVVPGDDGRHQRLGARLMRSEPPPF